MKRAEVFMVKVVKNTWMIVVDEIGWSWLSENIYENGLKLDVDPPFSQPTLRFSPAFATAAKMEKMLFGIYLAPAVLDTLGIGLIFWYMLIHIPVKSILGFPKMGVPLVIIHFRLGFSLTKTIYFGVPPFMETPIWYFLRDFPCAWFNLEDPSQKGAAPVSWSIKAHQIDVD